MADQTPVGPLRYQSSLETPAADEERTIANLVEQLRKIADTTYKHSGHGYRSVHAKSHGILTGELTVLDGLQPQLAQGIFSQPGSYAAILRLSTPAGDILDDSVSLPRGLAVKLIGVHGDRLPGSEQATTQDFVMINGPAFVKADAKGFLGALKLLAATTDHAEILKKALSATLRGVEKVLEAVGKKSATVLSMGGQPETHILGETFYSQVPILFGDFICKIAFFPISPELTKLTDSPLNVNGKPDGLREAVVDHFSTQGGEWEVRVQLCTDLDAMPIEDASVPWPEDRSPYLPVARLKVLPQQAWNDARARSIDDGLAFSPWHGVSSHRPLGSIMRARRVAYEALSRLRQERNGSPHVEPRSLDDLAL
jgi:hypothetical protein